MLEWWGSLGDGDANRVGLTLTVGLWLIKQAVFGVWAFLIIKPEEQLKSDLKSDPKADLGYSWRETPLSTLLFINASEERHASNRRK